MLGSISSGEIKKERRKMKTRQRKKKRSRGIAARIILKCNSRID